MIPIVAKFNEAETRYGLQPEFVQDLIDLNKPAYLNYFDFASGSVTLVELNTWIKLNTVTTEGFKRNGLVHTNNRVTNTGASKVFRLRGIVSAASGNNNEIHFAFFKNEEIVPCSEQDVVTSAAGRATAIPFECSTMLNTGDYVEVFVKNRTHNTSITIDNVNVEIIER
jgi:hypothetical protein